MEKVENIIFDLGGVILDVDYNLTRAAFEKLGVRNFDEMYSQANANKLFQKLETGEINEAEFYKELNRSTGLQLSIEEIKKAWNAMLLSFREGSLQFLEKIRWKYKVYLLSNTNLIHWNAFQQNFHSKKRTRSFEEYFDKAFYSFEMGLRKPGEAIFHQVIKELQIDPRKTVFIDDSAQNIEAAKKAGLQTILLTPDLKIEDLNL
jgi:putative hydrolase of the HAD superfamily